MIGKTLGKYRVIEKIGRGGMAEVYKAHHPGLDRHVAIKLVHSFLAEEEGFLERFQREARSIARLSHSNVVHVYDFDVADGTYYMVMEYLPGPSLKNHLAVLKARGEWLSLPEAVSIVRDVGQALEYAHDNGIFHRDVKPANIMLSQDRGAVLTDFGIVKMAGSSTQLTASGAMVGTPAYMAPEQSLQTSGDARIDIYSLGIVLYQLVTGQLPYDADTPMGIILKHVSTPLPAPSLLKPDLPQGIERVIFKALAKNPGNRYQSVREMLDHLEQAMQGLEVPEVDPAITTVSQTIEGVPTVIIQDSSVPTQMAGAPRDRGRRRPPLWVWGLAGLGLLSVLIVLAMTFAGQGDGPAATTALPTATHTLVSTATPTDTATPTRTPDQTATVEKATLNALLQTVGAPTPTPTRTSTPTQTPTGTPLPTPSSTATPEAFATVLEDGAELRQGADTRWYAHETLLAGTQLMLLGHDPDFPDWVYVSTVSGAATGWMQITDLETRRELDTLPQVTPVPTWTLAPAASPTLSAPSCEGGALWVDAWPVGDRVCTASGWTASVFVAGHGGNCLYTYYWEGEIVDGPKSGSTTFTVDIGGLGALVGSVLVSSGSETVKAPVYQNAPDCP